MARKLISEFVKVATSGPTIDGREIPESDIQDIADTYDVDEYTANIWYEHIRYFGNLGRVSELKTEKDGKGRLCLLAKLSPTDDLMYMNKNGQKLFTSIEIQPNFAGTNKAYLSGLAVTDSPASLGTSELQFSKRAQLPDNYFTSPVAIPAIVIEKSGGTFARVFKQFTSPDTTTEDEYAMSEELLTKLLNDSKKQMEKTDGLSERFSALEVSLKSKDESGPGEADENAGVSREDFNNLQASLTALSEKIRCVSERRAARNKPRRRHRE